MSLKVFSNDNFWKYLRKHGLSADTISFSIFCRPAPAFQKNCCLRFTNFGQPYDTNHCKYFENSKRYFHEDKILRQCTSLEKDFRVKPKLCKIIHKHVKYSAKKLTWYTRVPDFWHFFFFVSPSPIGGWLYFGLFTFFRISLLWDPPLPRLSLWSIYYVFTCQPAGSILPSCDPLYVLTCIRSSKFENNPDSENQMRIILLQFPYKNNTKMFPKTG